MAIVGSVTRSAVGNIAGPQQGNANAGAFVARAGITNLGFFASLGAAKQAVNGLSGRQLRWERSDLRGSVEHYVARDTTLDPLDIYGDNLLLWTEAEDNARVLSAANEYVDKLGDKSSNGYSFTQSDEDAQGSLVANAVNERAAIRLLVDRADNMVASVPLTPPWSMILVANYLGSGTSAGNLMLSDGDNPWRVGVTSRGQWVFENSAGATVAGGAPSATFDMLTVRQGETWGELRINRASAGGNGNYSSSGTQVSMGLAGAAPSVAGAWYGMFAAVIFADTTNITVTEEAERWVRSRYNTP